MRIPPHCTFLFRSIWALPLFALAAGCVSDTLSANQGAGSTGQDRLQTQNSRHASQPVDLTTGNSTNSQALAGENESNTALEHGPDPVKRQQAVSEMRAKGGHTSDQKTIIGPVPQSAGQPLSEEQQAQMAAQFQATKQVQRDYVSDSELQARHEAMRRLRKKGKRHYLDAVRSIER